MNRRSRYIAGVACACVAVALAILAVRSYFHSPSVTFRHHDLQWELVLDRGCIRLDNRPELDFEQRDLNRLQRIVDGRARAYLGTMLDGPSLESRTRMELAQAVRGVTASRDYGEAKRELARWQKIYTTKPVSHSIHLGFLIAILLLPALWQSRIWLRQRNRARNGLCVSCGYDIRATADRCPECGLSVLTRSRAIPDSPEMDLADFVPPSPIR